MSKKKRRDRIPKISEEQYGKYVMSLKDERPTKTIVPEDEKKK